MNKVILVGNLGADPETRFTPSGSQVTTVNLATDEFWTDRKGEQKHRTEWHRLVLWRRLAEIAIHYLRRGSKVYIEGRMQTRSWEDARSNRHYVTEIVVSGLHLMEAAGGPAELDLLYGRESVEPETGIGAVASVAVGHSDDADDDGLPL
ncbi:MAG: single-stranded DNA-binding protein [Candidatus Latescibacterota bacterium]|nr:single-stranded DNA-binding protein [Candidatus Latescibacterota bacterium]